MERQLTAQEIYDEFYFEVVNRCRAKGMTLPDEKEEVQMFKILLKAARKAIKAGDAPPDFLDELSEVRAIRAREREQATRMEAREKALREGTIIDFEDLLK